MEDVLTHNTLTYGYQSGMDIDMGHGIMDMAWFLPGGADERGVSSMEAL